MITPGKAGAKNSLLTSLFADILLLCGNVRLRPCIVRPGYVSYLFFLNLKRNKLIKWQRNSSAIDRLFIYSVEI